MKTTHVSFVGEALDAVLDRAQRLRMAGVLAVQVGECSVQFAPAVDTESRVGRRPTQDFPDDPLNDPATYGRHDGRVPGYPKPRKEEDEE